MSGKYVSNLPTIEFKNVNHSSLYSPSELLHKSLEFSACEACAVSKITQGSFHNCHFRATKPFEELHFWARDMNVSDNKQMRSTQAKHNANQPEGEDEVEKNKERKVSENEKERTDLRHKTRESGTNVGWLFFYHDQLGLTSVLGPISPLSHEGHKYFLTIVNSCTRFCSAIPIKHKNEFTEVIAQAVGLEAKRIGYFPSGHSSGHWSNQNCLLMSTSKLIQPKRHYTNIGAKGLLGTLIGYNDKLLSYKILGNDGRIINTEHLNFLDLPSSKTSSFDDEDLPILNEDGSDLSPESIESDPETPEELSKSISEEEELNADEEVAASLALNPSRTLRDRTAKVKFTKYSYLTSDPTSFKRAMQFEQKIAWSAATDEEIQNIEGHDVWEDQYEEPKSYLKTVWIFKINLSTLSSAEQKKACLCIQGFLQIPVYGRSWLFHPQMQAPFIFFHVDDIIVICNDLPGVSPSGGLSSASAPLYIPQLAIYHLNHNIHQLQFASFEDDQIEFNPFLKELEIELRSQTEAVKKIAESSQTLVVSQIPGATNNGASSEKKKGKRSGCQNGRHNPEVQHTTEECCHLHPEKCVAFHKAALERVKARFGPKASLSLKSGFADLIIFNSGASSHFLRDRAYFHTLSPTSLSVFGANGAPIPILVFGPATIPTVLGPLNLSLAYYSPRL
ncbi:hypothetical protein VP01_910g7 [Puccinia sorghi]|uniref:Reverse transcriptase Ty1/copia-type domain-containing protein n=1 Tax=Puccinia sorghi TaxID=27349 RepID=A0A0L6U7K0_9BASI|nr:hypothetical protein VP01_910g7 [Puccinia sorghi]